MSSQTVWRNSVPRKSASETAAFFEPIVQEKTLRSYDSSARIGKLQTITARLEAESQKEIESSQKSYEEKSAQTKHILKKVAKPKEKAVSVKEPEYHNFRYHERLGLMEQIKAKANEL